MWLVAFLEAIDPGCPLRRIGLGGIFQVRHSSFVHLLSDPALVPDVTMSAALVECREDPLHVGRAALRDRKPGPLVLADIDVGNRIISAYLWQSRAPRLKPPDRLEQCIRYYGIRRAVGRAIHREFSEPSTQWPLLHLGGILGSAALLTACPDSGYFATGSQGSPRRPISMFPLIRAAALKLAHAVSIAARRRDQDHSSSANRVPSGPWAIDSVYGASRRHAMHYGLVRHALRSEERRWLTVTLPTRPSGP